MEKKYTKDLIGWREWAELPDWNLINRLSIKAKIDTGARSCALHAEEIETFDKKGYLHVRFRPPYPGEELGPVIEAPLIDIRKIRSSNGIETERPVVRTHLKIGEHIFETDLTLINRDIMGFKMLIGRLALRKFFYVDSAKSFLLGKK